MDRNNHNILFCGTGGQGVLKAAEVLGVAAMLAVTVSRSPKFTAWRSGAVRSNRM